MTGVALHLKQQEVGKDALSATRKVPQNLSRSSHEKDLASTYQRPGVRLKILAFLLRVMPKVGPLRSLDFKRLTAETEKMYMASFNSTIDRYRELLSQQNAGNLKVSNANLDLETSTGASQYRLTVAAHSQLLHRLQGRYADLPHELRSDILAFYPDLDVPISTKTNAADSRRLLQELDHLQSVDADLRHPTVAGGGALPA
jgi:hypothetical protein